MQNKQLADILQLNNISTEQLEDKVYMTLILGVFEASCKDIKKQGTKIEEKERYRKAVDKTVVTKQIVKKYIGCELGEDEYRKISTYLAAFFSKDNYRKRYEASYREVLLKKQGNSCAICGKYIDVEEAHLDHIVPWDYVGDLLENNYQMLCETCNERKGTAAYFELSMLLINKKGIYD